MNEVNLHVELITFVAHNSHIYYKITSLYFSISNFEVLATFTSFHPNAQHVARVSIVITHQSNPSEPMVCACNGLYICNNGRV